MSITLGGVPEAFLPGQFVNLACQIGGERVKRAYSLSSAPGQNYEFLVSHVPDGVFTPSLFQLQAGDEIEVESRASGLFTLDWLPEFACELWLLATGTGLGPFMSMLRTPGLLFPRFDQVRLVHCVRTLEQLAYREELEQLANSPVSFDYLPTLSREPAQGLLSGRIPELIASGDLERRAALSFAVERSHFMLCGNPDMIRDVTECLSARGLQKHRRRAPGHISTEKYWT